jgi:hypothetical protein
MAIDEPRPYPWFYTVNDRPVKLVETTDGGVDALAFDWNTGGFVPERRYFSEISDHGYKDVDQLTARELVATCRVPAIAGLLTTTLSWEQTGDGEFPYRTAIGEQVLRIRVNDFPAEPLYSLLVGDDVLEVLDDWPPTWRRP